MGAQVGDTGVEAANNPAKIQTVSSINKMTRFGAWSLLALTLLIDASGIILIISTGFLNWKGSAEWGFGGPSGFAQLVILSLEPLITSGLGIAILLRSKNRRMGWLMLSIGCVGALSGFAEMHSAIAFGFQPESPMPLRWPLAWFVQWVWLVWLTLIAIVMPQIFPLGAPLKGRWHRLFQSSILYLAAMIVLLAFARLPLDDPSTGLEIPNPLGFIPVNEEVVIPAVMIPLLIFAVMSFLTLAIRFRRSRGDERQQIKWIYYALGVLFLSYWIFQGIEFFAGDQASSFWSALGVTVWRLGRFTLPLAIGFSILKYRLYEIDFLINRTLVYGALTTITVAVYIFLVTGLGSLVPAQNNLFLSLVATGVIAVFFNPLHIRLQHGVNRLMFGERDDPYTVLSHLGRVLSNSSTPGATLDTLVETVASALKLPYVAIHLAHNGSYEIIAEHGIAVPGLIELPVLYQNELVGKLLVASRAPGESLSSKDTLLLEDIAHQAGAVAHAVRLSAALQRSREMLVLAREEERQRIRRDLHDGLGPSLASQTFKLDSALDLLYKDPETVAEMLLTLKKQNQSLVADIRQLVYELRPPSLDDLGLSGVLSAHIAQINKANSLQIRISTSPDPIPPLPAAVEVAAYRISLEAMTNVVRHAKAREITVGIEISGSFLFIVIQDDGVGIPEHVKPGLGLVSMRERTEELGGTFEVAARRPKGTQITAMLPLEPSRKPSPTSKPSLPNNRKRARNGERDRGKP